MLIEEQEHIALFNACVQRLNYFFGRIELEREELVNLESFLFNDAFLDSVGLPRKDLWKLFVSSDHYDLGRLIYGSSSLSDAVISGWNGDFDIDRMETGLAYVFATLDQPLTIDYLKILIAFAEQHFSSEALISMDLEGACGYQYLLSHIAIRDEHHVVELIRQYVIDIEQCIDEESKLPVAARFLWDLTLDLELEGMNIIPILAFKLMKNNDLPLFCFRKVIFSRFPSCEAWLSAIKEGQLKFQDLVSNNYREPAPKMPYHNLISALERYSYGEVVERDTLSGRMLLYRPIVIRQKMNLILLNKMMRYLYNSCDSKKPLVDAMNACYAMLFKQYLGRDNEEEYQRIRSIVEMFDPRIDANNTDLIDIEAAASVLACQDAFAFELVINLIQQGFYDAKLQSKSTLFGLIMYQIEQRKGEDTVELQSKQDSIAQAFLSSPGFDVNCQRIDGLGLANAFVLLRKVKSLPFYIDLFGLSLAFGLWGRIVETGVTDEREREYIDYERETRRKGVEQTKKHFLQHIFDSDPLRVFLFQDFSFRYRPSVCQQIQHQRTLVTQVDYNHREKVSSLLLGMFPPIHHNTLSEKTSEVEVSNDGHVANSSPMKMKRHRPASFK